MIASPFREINVRLYIHLLPHHAGRFNAAVHDHMNKLLMKYHEDLEGVVIAYSNVRLQQENGVILADNPHIHFYVSATLLVLCPIIGNKLVGQVDKIGVDHIGLLIYGTLNASIPRDSIGTNLECDGQQEYWYDINQPDYQIRVGSVLQFTVTRLQTSQDILSIEGSLATQEAEYSQQPITTDSTEPRRREKPSRTAATVEVEESNEWAVTADNGNGHSNNGNESSTPSHKAKKARLEQVESNGSDTPSSSSKKDKKKKDKHETPSKHAKGED
ncbi:hypothetical protein CAOG_006651 [Capsaspora owczarzaki ATCC 30864]|uniref:Uncharacterized protein n=1 Tax=Capsaspora owczarzaki (strain ATCC 30864) TaxID=595528 RepID=A0A0D2X4M3_CAPO3|nr:hypothetical protein CAOG_006651 [Capsaspora owczarzaki ATCC 30864]